MSYRMREIESKLLVESEVSLQVISDILDSHLRATSQYTRSVYGTSTDTYYSLHNPDVKADFLRIREREDGVTEITVKAEDRDSRLDRMEIDIHSNSRKHSIMRLFGAALGRPSGIVKKTYYVWWLDQHTTVSAYSVTDPSYKNVFIEVESTEQERVLTLTAQVSQKLADLGIQVGDAPGSLFTMFIRGSEKK